MKINKKIRCLRCSTLVEENGTCSCGNLVLTNGKITLKEGIENIDTKDESAQLLTEGS